MSLSLEEKRKESLKRDWEAMCSPESGCKTQCCYFKGEPCEHLDIYKPSLNAGRCRIYSTRFGWHSTVGGKRLKCVPMHVRLIHVKAPDQCGYQGIRSVNGEMTKEFTV